ncbi:alpha/beta hydrolase [Nocardioides phosphati]|uniref:Alpha/beta hydrolase n=1 Tax=Nocardioides phosphati TaxID=1867775 RepID=A0ABQ2N8Q6_9ACTN|nr:alpha/beta hydrolase [Nocardioides phosphati]GGO86155.1 alpha/beta hydrolase [Nocardioides phosphati]
MSEVTEVEGVDQFAQLASGIRICFRDHGSGTDPAILLVAGLGEDQTFWGDSFVASLVARGYRVITMDNRDVGQSTFVTTPPPGILRQAFARPRQDGYTLADMARDCVGVLDHLGIEQVHLVGRSMGGMIAQTVAATSPQRVLSLTSIYSTTGSTKVGQPAKSTIRLLVTAPALRTRTDAVRAHLRLTQHIAGSAYPIDDAEEARIAARGWDRSAGDPADGVARQIQAIQRSGDRTAQLRTITAPTLVIHGDRDLMVAPSGGVASAAAIPSAQHVVIPGMGHHIPASLVEPITRYIAGQADRVTAGGNHVEIS